MSTHSIGPVRLLLGCLLLLLLGASAFWFLWGSGGTKVLTIRDGPFEVEPWTGALTPDGADLVWDYQPTTIELYVYRSKADEAAEDEVQGPVPIDGATSVHVDFRLASGSTISDAVVLSMAGPRMRFSASGGRLRNVGDVWVHPGFVQNGTQQRARIARLEFRGANDVVVARYQDLDQGRRVRFRIKMTQ